MDLLPLLEAALEFRQKLLQENPSLVSLRLFNGVWEGWPEFVVDLFGNTLMINGYAQSEERNIKAAEQIQNFYQPVFNLRAVILKDRLAASQEARRGILLLGNTPDTSTTEYGVQYALDLRLNRDASLYLDTRLLRRWAIENLSGADVLNTFAYTGSLGSAALAGGARYVIQTDLSDRFLSLARKTYQLNAWKGQRQDLMAGNFFTVIARLKRQARLFDCVFIDPPFFSSTPEGRVDLNKDYIRLINKVRPLVSDGGRLVVVNNAVFVSGRSFLQSLQDLTLSGYIEIEQLLPAPSDFTGFNAQPLLPLPADPFPFNYSTKIVILRVQRKDKRKAH
jgi:23S rRNA (cytosine1962-C5)-methyltransferase